MTRCRMHSENERGAKNMVFRLSSRGLMTSVAIIALFSAQAHAVEDAAFGNAIEEDLFADLVPLGQDDLAAQRGGIKVGNLEVSIGFTLHQSVSDRNSGHSVNIVSNFGLGAGTYVSKSNSKTDKNKVNVENAGKVGNVGNIGNVGNVGNVGTAVATKTVSVGGLSNVTWGSGTSLSKTKEAEQLAAADAGQQIPSDAGASHGSFIETIAQGIAQKYSGNVVSVDEVATQPKGQQVTNDPTSVAGILDKSGVNDNPQGGLVDLSGIIGGAASQKDESSVGNTTFNGGPSDQPTEKGSSSGSGTGLAALGGTGPQEQAPPDFEPTVTTSEDGKKTEVVFNGGATKLVVDTQDGYTSHFENSADNIDYQSTYSANIGLNGYQQFSFDLDSFRQQSNLRDQLNFLNTLSRY